MASYKTLENTPIEIDLTIQGRSTGWSLNGDIATHEACNAGSMFLKNYYLDVGETIEYSYNINSISGGYIQARLGGVSTSNKTTTGFVTEQMTSTANGSVFSFYSNADTEIQLFTLKKLAPITTSKQQNTISWSEGYNKWNSFYNFNPDCAFSIFTDFFSLKNGRIWAHKRSLPTRNNLYGVQYQTILNIPFNKGQGASLTYESISYESNQLMITTTDGIKTKLGQVSELISQDFLKDILDDGIDQVNIYSVEGVFSASFMRDKNIDIINGDVLKGQWITVELITISPDVLKISNVLVNSTPSKIGAR